MSRVASVKDKADAVAVMESTDDLLIKLHRFLFFRRLATGKYRKPVGADGNCRAVVTEKNLRSQHVVHI